MRGAEVLWSAQPDIVGYETCLPWEWLQEYAPSSMVDAGDALLAAEDRMPALALALAASISVAISGTEMDKGARQALSELRRKLATGAQIGPALLDKLGVCPEVSALAHVHVEAGAAVGKVKRDFNDTYSRTSAEVANALFARSKDPLLAHSLRTTNPRFADHLESLDNLLGPQSATLSGHKRKLARRIWFYIQRGAAKTHVASLLGTVCFARLLPEDPSSMIVERLPPQGRTARAGLAPIARAHTFISYWAVSALARSIETDCEIAPFLPLRRRGTIEPLGGARFKCHLSGEIFVLSPAQSGLVECCDGKRTLRDLSEALSLEPDAAFRDFAELLRQNRIVSALEPPATVFDPLVWLTERLAALPSTDARQRWLTGLQEIERRRVRLESAQAAAKPGAVAHLRRSFTKLTSLEPCRNRGQTYGDREIFYEECASRNFYKFGAPFLDKLNEDLSPVLEIFFTFGTLLDRQFKDIAKVTMQSMVAPGSCVPFTDFCRQMNRLSEAGELPGEHNGMLEFERLWGQLVSHRSAEHTDGIARLQPSDIDALTSFSAGIMQSAHATLDLFVSAPDRESIRRGDFNLVIGEIEENVMAWGSQFYFHPENDEVGRRVTDAFRNLAGYRQLCMILPQRLHKGLVNETFAAGNRFVTAEAVTKEPGRDLPLSALKVRLCEDVATLIDENGNPLQFFHHHDALAHLWAFSAPRVQIPGRVAWPKMPRIVFNNVCVSRAQATFSTGEFRQNKNNPARIYVILRRCLDEAGIGRYLFIHSPAEPKPFFADAQSPLAIDTVTYLCSKADSIRFVEMLPEPHCFWNKDKGHSFATEFRVLMLRNGLEASRRAA